MTRVGCWLQCECVRVWLRTLVHRFEGAARYSPLVFAGVGMPDEFRDALLYVQGAVASADNRKIKEADPDAICVAMNNCEQFSDGSGGDGKPSGKDFADARRKRDAEEARMAEADLHDEWRRAPNNASTCVYGDFPPLWVETMRAFYPRLQASRRCCGGDERACRVGQPAALPTVAWRQRSAPANQLPACARAQPKPRVADAADAKPDRALAAPDTAARRVRQGA